MRTRRPPHCTAGRSSSLRGGLRCTCTGGCPHTHAISSLRSSARACIAASISPGGTGVCPGRQAARACIAHAEEGPAAADRAGGCIACSQAFAAAQRASRRPLALTCQDHSQQRLAPGKGASCRPLSVSAHPPYRGNMCRLDWVPVSILGLEQAWQFTTKTCNELAHDAATCTATQAHGPSAGCRSFMQYLRHGKRCLPPAATGLGLSDPTSLPAALQACEARGSSRRCCTWRSWQPLLRRRVRAVYLQCCSTADCLNTQPLGAISHKPVLCSALQSRCTPGIH